MISQGEVLSVDEFGRLALHYAAEQGHDICLEVLCASFLKGSIEVEVQSALRPCFASLGISLINYFYSVGFFTIKEQVCFYKHKQTKSWVCCFYGVLGPSEPSATPESIFLLRSDAVNN